MSAFGRILPIALPNNTAAGTTILFKAPSDAAGGGITILEAVRTFGQNGGTVTLARLIDMGTTGTVVTSAGTVCSLGSVASGGSVLAGSPAGYFLDNDRYLAFENGAGTVGAGSYLHITYTLGR